MKNLNKKIKMGTVFNLLLLVVIYVLCYYISSTDFTGACSECAADESMVNFFMGEIFWFLQVILGIFMFLSAKNMEKTRYTGGIVSFAVFSILIMLIQIKMVFSTTPYLETHEDYEIENIDMIMGSYNVGRVLYVLMIAYYVTLIVMAVYKGRQMKNEDAE